MGSSSTDMVAVRGRYSYVWCRGELVLAGRYCWERWCRSASRGVESRVDVMESKVRITRASFGVTMLRARVG
jgi:hypothetical protein